MEESHLLAGVIQAVQAEYHGKNSLSLQMLYL